MSRGGKTKNELDATIALEQTLQTLQRTETAFAKLCEELRQERRRTAQAVRCVDEYRRLYWMARARLASVKKMSRADLRPSQRAKLTAIGSGKKVAQFPIPPDVRPVVTRR